MQADSLSGTSYSHKTSHTLSRQNRTRVDRVMVNPLDLGSPRVKPVRPAHPRFESRVNAGVVCTLFGTAGVRVMGGGFEGDGKRRASRAAMI